MAAAEVSKKADCRVVTVNELLAVGGTQENILQGSCRRGPERGLLWFAGHSEAKAVL